MNATATNHQPSLLSNKNFRNLWLGQTISFFGNSIYNVSISWYVFERTGSAFQVALLLITSFLPQMLFGLFLGAAADRWNRKRLLQISDAFCALTVGLLALAFYLSSFRLWEIYVVSVCLSLSQSLFSNALSGWLPDMVGNEHLLRANSMLTTSRQINRLIGATVGGILVAGLGAALAIGVDALTFMLSLLFVQFAKYQTVAPKEPAVAKQKTMWADIKEGLAWLHGQPVILILVLVGMLSNVALGPTNVVPAMYIQSELHASASALGIFDAAIGLGLLLGGIVIGWLSPKRVGVWFLSGFVVQALGMLIVSQAPNLAVACCGNFLLGFAVIMASLPMGTLSQVMTPSAMRGRVNAVMSMGFNLAIPITYGGIGALAGFIGSRWTYVLGGSLMLVCVLLGLLSSQLRAYRLPSATSETPVTSA